MSLVFVFYHIFVLSILSVLWLTRKQCNRYMLEKILHYEHTSSLVMAIHVLHLKWKKLKIKKKTLNNEICAGSLWLSLRLEGNTFLDIAVTDQHPNMVSKRPLGLRQIIIQFASNEAGVWLFKKVLWTLLSRASDLFYNFLCFPWSPDNLRTNPLKH